MARYRWRYDKDGVAHPIDEETALVTPMYYVIPDIKPYRSMADGKMVEGRRQHREMLKANNCYEVGDQTHHLKPKQMTPPPGLKQRLIEVVNSKL